MLLGSFAERYMKEHFGDVVEVLPTKEVDETFQLVEDGERHGRDGPGLAGGRLLRPGWPAAQS